MLGNFVKFTKLYSWIAMLGSGSTKASGSEPKSCLGRVFNCKLGSLAKCTACLQPLLELKTQPRFGPIV
jgi:hypothetical protein